MKKHTEKLPIDDLFAQKLGNMSLPPSADGFKRLQARMGQQKPEVRVVFWRNPTLQRAISVAACFLLVCLLGWRYWPLSGPAEQSQKQVAINYQTVPPPTSVQKQLGQQPDKVMPDEANSSPLSREENTKQIALTGESAAENKQNNDLASQPVGSNKATTAIQPARNELILAQTKSFEDKPEPTNGSMPNNAPPVIQETVGQLTENKTIARPVPVAERVLIVTIAEPQALVAAQQMNKAPVEEKPMIAQNNKSENEPKVSGLWQQVKRIRQGELLARQDNPNNDERGLLSRAYSGLRHSFEKDKSAKQ